MHAVTECNVNNIQTHSTTAAFSSAAFCSQLLFSLLLRLSKNFCVCIRYLHVWICTLNTENTRHPCTMCMYGLFCDYKLKSLHVNRWFAIKIRSQPAAMAATAAAMTMVHGCTADSVQEMQDATNRQQTNIFRLHEARIGNGIIHEIFTKLHAKFATRVSKKRKKRILRWRWNWSQQ